ncbi:ribosome hibernation-promoting factor, HPF/YfiA family [Companilactobacillus sp. DQM5]|uniref:ribosome hibernation-promoting factor, HPF/YfiA family n=1 Tax=Companilactobacillus sp. DQM5 TaxID=3463359 RepID=UPI00405A2956
MLKINVRGENIEVTEAIRNYVIKKLERMNKYFDVNTEPTAHVNLKVYPNSKTKVEVTIPLPYLVLRAEELNDDLYAGIDLVIDKLERQVRKYKTKINRKSREKGLKDFVAVDEEITDDEIENELRVVRTKHVALKPMDVEEAILQMNMLEHDFFIFEDAETNGISIVYKRNDGKFALIETGE